jgi:hypothetical protein
VSAVYGKPELTVLGSVRELVLANGKGEPNWLLGVGSEQRAWIRRTARALADSETRLLMTPAAKSGGSSK